MSLNLNFEPFMKNATKFYFVWELNNAHPEVSSRAESEALNWFSLAMSSRSHNMNKDILPIELFVGENQDSSLQ